MKDSLIKRFVIGTFVTLYALVSIDNLQKLKEDGLSYISIESIDKELDEIVEKLIKYQN